MAIAQRIDTFVAPTVTQQSLYDGIKASFANTGFTAPFDEFVTGTDKIVVYAIVLDNTKTYGTTYLRVRVTSTLIINQQLFSTWVVSTHTGTNASTEIAYTTVATNVQVNFVALNGGNEFKLAVLTHGVNIAVLGFIAPTNKPTWWDLNSWNYCFISTTFSFAVLRSSALNPYSNSENDSSLNAARMINANGQTNRRDLLPGVIIYTQAGQGVSGRTSDDLVMVAASGTTRYDTIQIPGDTKQYLILNPGTGGLAIRVA